MTRDERTLEEKYNHAPGSFHATVDAYDLAGEPEFSILVRRVCRERHVWPPLLFSGNRKGFVVVARRLIWRGAYEPPVDLSVENIAEIFGYSPATVRPFATSWRALERAEGAEWWSFWGLALADLVGVPLEDA